jgi:hypothetical protein
LHRATNGDKVTLFKDVTKTWEDNVYINNHGADITLIITKDYTNNILGMATHMSVGKITSVAVLSNTSAVLLMHEVGHLFGLNHRDGVNVMNSIPTIAKFSNEDLEYLSQF